MPNDNTGKRKQWIVRTSEGFKRFYDAPDDLVISSEETLTPEVVDGNKLTFGCSFGAISQYLGLPFRILGAGHYVSHEKYEEEIR